MKWVVNIVMTKVERYELQDAVVIEADTAEEAAGIVAYMDPWELEPAMLGNLKNADIHPNWDFSETDEQECTDIEVDEEPLENDIATRFVAEKSEALNNKNES